MKRLALTFMTVAIGAAQQGWYPHEGGLMKYRANIRFGEEPDTIEEVYEPYLIQLGFLHRTPRGRVATERAFDYFKVERRLRTGEQPALF